MINLRFYLPLAFALCSNVATADDVEKFFKEKSLRILVGYATGTGYDIYARALGRHIGAHIPGNPKVVPQNMPGAASLVMMNHLYNVAPRDGTAIALPARNLFVEPLLGNDRAQYDPRKFSMIGNMSRDVALCVAWHTTGIASVADVRRREVLVAATSPSAITAIYPQVLNSVLKTKMKIITGYTDSKAISVALESGEVEAYCGYSIASIRSAHPDWLNKKLVNIFVQLGLEKSPELPETSFVMDFVQDQSSKDVLSLVFGDLTLGRPVIGPPVIPTERLRALRDAFDKTMTDPGFLADASKVKIDIEPMNATEADKILRQILDVRPEIVQRVNQIRQLK
ncbi:MAG: hypothetical protein Q8M03_09200 [Legionella sp.]|nr:hypothetical protein [Legionella sp.]